MTDAAARRAQQGAPAPTPGAPDGAAVRAMFARVAGRYDRANHLLSMGVDRLWRRAAVRAAEVAAGDRVLDVCAGTGDLAASLAAAGARVTGVDFCFEMLAGAVGKGRRALHAPRWATADALALPFADDSFDAATVAFGIRNVSDPVRGLAEMARVVKPGGAVVVLEFGVPRVPVLSAGYLWYFRKVLPRLGRWISGDRDGAYDYLPESVMQFPERDAFLALMRDAGLESAQYRGLTGGIAMLYRARVRS